MITTLALADGPIAHWAPWLWWIHPLFTLAITALVITALILLIRRLVRGPRHLHGGPWGAPWSGHGVRSAESTLADRFANGDIDEKEYRARLEVLRAQGVTPPR